MNKKIYVGVYAGSFGLMVLSVAAVVFAGDTIVSILQSFGIAEYDAGNILGQFVAFALIQLLVTHAVYQFVILAKMWSSINDGCARATPLSAIGLLFIPFYNIYWIFQAWSGFVNDYESYVDRHRLSAPYISSSVFKIYPVSLLLSALPVLGSIFTVANFVIFAMIISETCDAVNALQDARLEAAKRGDRYEMNPAGPARSNLVLNI